MMWSKVIPDIVSKMKSNGALITALGGAYIYRSRSRSDIQIPAIGWTVVSSSLGENYAPVTVQLDIWAHDTKTGAAIETLLYGMLHNDLPQQFPTLLMWGTFRNRYDIHDGEQGVWHSAAEYVFTPARENG